ncbi:hypothetical protein [Sphaerisporangium fuscum]|uniref:hypothetical protein n=1 Tax=Sphaerisporangium fuscum TaxID=2835868 RepID=UPI001BDD8417|nr:hypothetical protein [Sphaerisporangium fuscum]
MTGRPNDTNSPRRNRGARGANRPRRARSPEGAERTDDPDRRAGRGDGAGRSAVPQRDDGGYGAYPEQPGGAGHAQPPEGGYGAYPGHVRPPEGGYGAYPQQPGGAGHVQSPGNAYGAYPQQPGHVQPPEGPYPRRAEHADAPHRPSWAEVADHMEGTGYAPPAERPQPAQPDDGGKKAKGSKRRRSSFEVEALSESGMSPGRQRLLIAVGTVLVVLLGGAGLTYVISTLGVDAPPSRQGAAADGIGLPVPEEYEAWPSPKLFGPIADRKADAAPLKAEEVFSAKSLTSDKVTLKLLDRRLDGSCAQVMWGGSTVAKLTGTGCTQAVRGLYLSADRRYVAQYTLFNMASGSAAEGFVQAMSTEYRGGGWVRALQSSAATFGPDGYSEGSGHAMGHYAGFVWVARADGHEPGAKDDFVSLALAARGAEKAIYRRVVAVTGTGATPPAK